MDIATSQQGRKNQRGGYRGVKLTGWPQESFEAAECVGQQQGVWSQGLEWGQANKESLPSHVCWHPYPDQCVRCAWFGEEGIAGTVGH